MIVPADIANIIYSDCKAFGIERVADGQTITAPLTEERITIHAKAQQPSKYWRKSFVEVNFLVPDLAPLASEANSIRLNELMREAAAKLDAVTGEFDGTPYRYTVDDIGIEADTTLRCHYVNARLLFKVLNV